MAATSEEVPEKTLEYWLSRATDPFLSETSRVEYVKGFCEQVNQELEGHLVACRLLAHKIQSPHEKEALNALNVLEACVKNCGQRFHNEIAKFRFLNEVIKILSPKYLGNQTSDKVKQKAVEVLYTWKMGLKHLPKLKQAYDMLKEQGVILQDPTYMNEIFEPPPPAPKPKFASFEDEEKSRLLSQLLKSKNPDDLQAANRLIKSMVKAEDQRIEKVSKRSTDLETACNNARLLTEMISQFNKNSAAQQEVEIMKDLAESLQKLRPTLFRYAGEAAEGEEEVLAEILGVNDEVGKALEEFRTLVEPYVQSMASNKTPPSSTTSGNYSLLNFDTQAGQQQQQQVRSSMIPDILSTSSSETSLLGDDVLMLGGGGTPLMSRRLNSGLTTTGTSAVTELNDLFGGASQFGGSMSSSQKPANVAGLNLPAKSSGNVQQQPTTSSKPKGLLDLDALSEALIQQNLPSGATSVAQIQQNKKLSLRDLNQKQDYNPTKPSAPPSFSPLDPFGPSSSSTQTAVSSPMVTTTSTVVDHPQQTTRKSSLKSSELKPLPLTPNPTPEMSAAGSPIVDLDSSTSSSVCSTKNNPACLDDVEVALESIKPASKSPLLVLERDQLKIVLHYAANKPRHDITTTVVSITSTRDQILTDIRFSMRVRESPVGVIIKLQPPTNTTLPAYNPIFPLTAITQILLLASNSVSTENIPLEYSLSYSAANQQYSVSGLTEIELSH